MGSYYPQVGFHFRVVFEGPFGDSDMRFQAVSGLTAELDVEQIKEGGENRFTHRLPGPAKYNNLVLKRGMLVGTKLIAWFEAALQGFIFQPTGINVFLLNSEHEPVAGWHFVNAYPVKWATGDLDAMQNTVLVETLEFAYQYYTQIPIPGAKPSTIESLINKIL